MRRLIGVGLVLVLLLALLPGAVLASPPQPLVPMGVGAMAYIYVPISARAEIGSRGGSGTITVDVSNLMARGYSSAWVRYEFWYRLPGERYWQRGPYTYRYIYQATDSFTASWSPLPNGSTVFWYVYAVTPDGKYWGYVWGYLNIIPPYRSDFEVVVTDKNGKPVNGATVWAGVIDGAGKFHDVAGLSETPRFTEVDNHGTGEPGRAHIYVFDWVNGHYGVKVHYWDGTKLHEKIVGIDGVPGGRVRLDVRLLDLSV